MCRDCLSSMIFEHMIHIDAVLTLIDHDHDYLGNTNIKLLLIHSNPGFVVETQQQCLFKFDLCKDLKFEFWWV